jgi:hypothetical protein
VTRLVLYLLLLAVVFALAAAIGRAVGPLERGGGDDDHALVLRSAT